MKKKLDVLKYIANEFNKHHITWNLGASCMLYFRGIVTKFNDIDIMVKSSDVPLIKEILKEYPLEERIPNEQYRTKVFLEYIINGIEIDIMSDFIIIHEGLEHHFPLENDETSDVFTFDNTTLYLEQVEVWYNYYKLMNRTDKVQILKNYVEGE